MTEIFLKMQMSKAFVIAKDEKHTVTFSRMSRNEAL